MCGIVGYVGSKPTVDVLLEGLRKLEYRGYDSSGIACVSLSKKDEVFRHRAVGKISELSSSLEQIQIPTDLSAGIGHTRWATHGGPSVDNAHPHISRQGRIAVVHNGIIENEKILRNQLIAEGVVFTSETDTEVLAHLIEKELTLIESSLVDGQGELDDKFHLREAVLSVLHQVNGAWGIAVIDSHFPDRIIGAKNGSPLVLGLKENSYTLASDATALAGLYENVIYLEDGDLVDLSSSGFDIVNLSHHIQFRQAEALEADAEEVAKNGYDHFMIKEIMEQGDTLENTLRGRLLIEEGTTKLSGLEENMQELRKVNRLLIIACGTSYYAGLVGENIIEDLAGIPVEVAIASEFRYSNPIITPETMVVIISQSGETADTLAAMQEAKRRGASVLGIVNTVGSTIARGSDAGVYLHAGPEIGVASTKAFTSQVAVLSMMGILLGRMRRVSNVHGRELVLGLSQIPNMVRDILSQSDVIRQYAHEFCDKQHMFYLGRNLLYAVALEGALKMKEISYMYAEAYPTGELKHGPIALIEEGTPVVFLLPVEPVLREKACSNLREIQARGAKVLLIGGPEGMGAELNVEGHIPLPEVENVLSPIIYTIPLQLLSYEAAIMRDCSVDQPRNLAKSVTVE